jgi:hypothetical protein
MVLVRTTAPEPIAEPARRGAAPPHALMVLAGVVLAASIASAARADEQGPRQTSPGDAAAAEALFDQGRKLIAAGKVRQACPKFAESYRLDPALGSLLNLATCHQMDGKTATAWGEFRDAEQQARRAGDTKRQKFAADKAAALEPTLPKLIVTVVDPAPGLVVSRDGIALGDASFNTALPVDPGAHVISAQAPGYKRWETRFESAASQRSSVVVPALERDDSPAEPAAGSPTDSAAPVADRPADGGSTGRTVGLVVAGVGVASLAVGGVFAGLFFSARSDCEATEACRNDEEHPDRDTMNTRGTISGVALGIGAAAVIAGGIIYFTAPSADASSSPQALRLVPLLGPGVAGASGSFAF